MVFLAILLLDVMPLECIWLHDNDVILLVVGKVLWVKQAPVVVEPNMTKALPSIVLPEPVYACHLIQCMVEM